MFMISPLPLPPIPLMINLWASQELQLLLQQQQQIEQQMQQLLKQQQQQQQQEQEHALFDPFN